jgi:hypothetical protein
MWPLSAIARGCPDDRIRRWTSARAREPFGDGVMTRAALARRALCPGGARPDRPRPHDCMGDPSIVPMDAALMSEIAAWQPSVRIVGAIACHARIPRVAGR